MDGRDLLEFADGTANPASLDLPKAALVGAEDPAYAGGSYASPGSGQYCTYFIGYSRHLWVVEKMLERMFIGDPPPLHDRILDFSKAVTGTAFFVPARQILSDLGG